MTEKHTKYQTPGFGPVQDSFTGGRGEEEVVASDRAGAPLVVTKFGGTSVGDIVQIRKAADRIKQLWSEGQRVIAVVSAMGDETDRLMDLVNSITRNPNRRELDMLLTSGERITMALLAIILNDNGVPAISFTGSQSGIITDTAHTRAKIVTIRASRIEAELASGKVVVVAGFQGVSRTKEVTTLGRGGSDTTAVALAGTLGATRCEIYTDVPGIFAIDPRLRESASRIPVISFDEMIELSGAGSQVMETRSVIFAQRFDLPLWVGSLVFPNAGTIINSRGGTSDRPVLGVALSKGETIFSLIGCPDCQSDFTRLLSDFAQNNIPLELLYQNLPRTDRIIYTIIIPDAETLQIEQNINRLIGNREVKQVVKWDNLARVSIIGQGMKGVPGITVTMLGALYDHKIPVFITSTSDVRISAYIPRKMGQNAVNCIADVFGLA